MRLFYRGNGWPGDLFEVATKQRGKKWRPKWCECGLNGIRRIARAGDASGMASRWRREEYDVVRHDKCFSEWKILVSPSDWKEQGPGREAGERFRSRNLPGPLFGSGVYELGVTLPVWRALDLSDGRALKSEDVVVVYVGHADHIRKRLQRYGQAGAHLEGSRSPKSPTSRKDYVMHFAQYHEDVESSSGEEYLNKYSQSASENRYFRVDSRRSGRYENQFSIPENRISVPESSPGRQTHRGPRLFAEVFGMGCSIAYRWASTRNKEVAEYIVSDLTAVFDYAWNRGGSSPTRSHDILVRILSGKRGSHTSCCSRSSSKWVGIPFMRKVVGVKVAARRPAEGKVRRLLSQGDGRGLLMLWKKSPPMMIIGGGKSTKPHEFTKINIPVDRCGVILENGLVCNGLPQKGLKRCLVHVDAKKPIRRKASQVASQDSRSGSLASDPPSVGSPKNLSLPKAPSSCFPIRIPKKPKPQEPKRRGSVSFNTWLGRSEMLKAKGVEWLLAMEEIKGGGHVKKSYSDVSTSPILKPEMSPVEEPTPVRVNRISLNLAQSGRLRERSSYPDEVDGVPIVDNGKACSVVSRRSPARWPPAPLRDSYATSLPPQFPRISFT